MIEKIKINQIKPTPNNPRVIKGDKYKKLVQSIKDFPEMLKIRPIVVDEAGVVLGGNMRLRACKEAGLEEVWIIKAEDLTDAQKSEFIIKDNSNYGEWDWGLLIKDWDLNLVADWGVDVPKKDYKDGLVNFGTKLTERFVAPPFSILDTKQGYWQERKNWWNEYLNEWGESREYTLSKGENNCAFNAFQKIGTVSLFDPVLAEISFHWFSPEDAKIIDPFAGDTRKGSVAAKLGRQFTGIELRQEQVDINYKKIRANSLEANLKYICDSGVNIDKYIEPLSSDMIFSCPPYYNLEHYSDLKEDASNAETYEDFIKLLKEAFVKSIKCLKEGRFAVIVVGDIRDKKGGYRDFPGDIKRIFMGEGMMLYNDIILADSIGSSGIRANQMMKNRKVVKVHQNVLVFYKGNPETIRADFPSLDFKSIEGETEDVLATQISHFLKK